MVTLLLEVLQVAKQLTKGAAPVTHRNLKAAPGLKKTAAVGKPNQSGAAGIFPHQSKYNPWRAYAWNPAQTKQVYLGAFPTLKAAKSARAAFLKGEPVTTGTTGTKVKSQAYKAAAALELVKKAA